MTTGNVLLSTTEYVRINAGLNPVLLQAHRDSVRIVFSDVKPARSTSAYHSIGGNEAPLQIPTIDTNIWVLAVTDTSSLTITEINRSASARTFSSDFLLEVSKGLIPGHKLVYVNAHANSISTTTKLIWPEASQYVFSDTPSSLWLSSNNAADNQDILIEWLDADYNQQTSIVTLNGQTPVEFANGIGLRVNRLRSLIGTVGNVYVARGNNHTGGVPQSALIVSMFEPVDQVSSLSLFTVPAGKTLFGLTGYFSAPKGRDADFYWNIRNPAAGVPAATTNVVSAYQSTIEINFAMTVVPEKTDASFSARTEQGTGRVSSRVVGILVDNDKL